jgi:hypothetical protein
LVFLIPEDKLWLHDENDSDEAENSEQKTNGVQWFLHGEGCTCMSRDGYFEVEGLDEEDEDGADVVEGRRGAHGQVLQAVHHRYRRTTHAHHSQHHSPEG